MVGASKEERAPTVGFALRKRLPAPSRTRSPGSTALAVLLPLVAGQSGNTGAQALAATMRGLALREVRLWHWLPVAFKELRVAALNGVAVAAVTCLGVYLWSR